MATTITTPDVLVTNEGTVFRFEMQTDAAREWVAAYVDIPGWARLSPDVFAVDHRMAGPLADGMIDAGLVLQ